MTVRSSLSENGTLLSNTNVLWNLSLVIDLLCSRVAHLGESPPPIGEDMQVIENCLEIQDRNSNLFFFSSATHFDRL